MKYLKYFESSYGCENRNLTSLKDLNLPRICGLDFDCSSNPLVSLEYCSEIIEGDFW